MLVYLQHIKFVKFKLIVLKFKTTKLLVLLHKKLTFVQYILDKK